MQQTRTYLSGGWKLSLAVMSAVTSFSFYPASAQEPNAVPQSEDSLGGEGGNGEGRSRLAQGGRGSNAVQAPAEFDEQAKSILASSARAYAGLQSWHVEQEVVNSGRLTKKVTVDFRAPHSLTVTTTEPKGIKTVAHYDRENVTTIRDFDGLQEYQVRRINRGGPPADGETVSNPRLSFGDAVGPELSNFFAGEENVFGRQAVQSVKYAGESEVNGVPVENITVTSRRYNRPSTTTYSIGKADSLLHKVVQNSQNADGTPREYVETYSNQKTNPEISASVFEIVLPAAAKKVDRFTSSRGIQIEVGDTALPIKTKDIDGKELSLDQYKGKVVLLDFWATWCAPCRAELPHVKATYAKYKDQGFDILGISLDQTVNPLKPFVAKESLGWRQVYDGYWNGPIAKAYNVRFIPSTILIGRDGKVAAVNVRGEKLEAAIEAALTG